MVRPSGNGSNTRVIEETVLRLFQRRGYVITRPSGDLGGTLAILQARDHRALACFQWGHERLWTVDLIRTFHDQMDGLRATRGYLFTDGLFDAATRDLAETLGVTLTDGTGLQEAVFAAVPGMRRPGYREEPPLPFDKYIPWFVGISLVVLAVGVLLLISVALSLTPVPTAT
jgi:hypothetical protein